MKKIFLILLMVFTIAMYSNIHAQQCGITTYLLDVEASYNKKDNSITVLVTNPKPLKSEGKLLNITKTKNSVYQGKDLIKEMDVSDFTIKPAEKKEFKVDNLTEDVGKDVVSVVVSGQTASAPKLEVGSLHIGLSKSIPTGVACGDDVLHY